MSEAKTDGLYTLTAPVPTSFLNVFVAKPFMRNGKAVGEPKYSGEFHFPADSADLKAMKALAAKLARAKWPDKKFEDILWPFSKGEKRIEKRKAKGKEDSDHLAGKVIIAARSKYAPRLSYIANGKIVDVEGDTVTAVAKAQFYPGVECLAQFNFLAYDAVGEGGKDGVTAYLNMVLSIGKGERLAGGMSADEAFKGYVGTMSTESPTGGAEIDDGIPY